VKHAKILLSVSLLASSVLLGGCKGAVVKTEQAGPPPGEVWLTDAQIAEAKVKVQPLTEQDVDDVIVTSGKVSFEESRVSHVFSPVSGRIVRVEAKTGQRVKKGETLAVIESPDIGIASADLQKAQADVVAAQHDLERQREMLAAHATSQRDYEQAEDSYRKAVAEVDRAKQKTGLFRGGGGAGVSQTYALRSPIDGEIVTRNAAEGVEVAGQYGGSAVELFTIGELDKVWVIADVYEIDSARVKVGSKVHIKLFAFPNKVFPSTIEWVAGSLDAATRTARVRCVLDNPDRSLKPEMYATLFISVDERKTLAIPRNALLRIGEQIVVFVEKGKSPDGRHIYARTPVTVDEGEGGTWLPVTHGLEKGAPVVVEGGILLSGGTEGK
jgi:cobalt-zinc-cadmium efflux system membrane fusion protein